MKLYSGIIELKPGWFVRLPYPMTEMEFGRYKFGPLAIPLIIGGTGLMAAGQLYAGRAAAAEGRSAQNIANYNAAVQEQEAKAITAKSIFEQQRQAEAAARIQGRLRAKLAASGALPDVGTPLLLQEEQAAELELENLMIGYEGQVMAGRAMSQAELDRLQGALSYQKGKAAQTASYLQAGGTLLTGFGTAGLLDPSFGKSWLLRPKNIGGSPLSSTSYQGTMYA